MRKFISCLLCFLLLFSFGLTAFASDEKKDIYIYDFDNVGQILETMDEDTFKQLSQNQKEKLYSITIEDMVNAPEDSNENSRIVLAPYYLNGSSPTPGSLRVNSWISATSPCPYLSIVLIVYDSNGKIVETQTEYERNEKLVSNQINIDGLNQGVYEAFAQFHIEYPIGEPEASDIGYKSKNILVY